MTDSTKSIYDLYKKEHFISETLKANEIKNEFKNFLDTVVKNDVTIRDVQKVIVNTFTK